MRFDMTKEKGVPVPVPLTPAHNITASDAIYLPPRYNGTVLLAAVDAEGVEVLRSKDGKWTAAERLGQVSNSASMQKGGFVTACVQVGTRLYMVEEYFGDTQPGNRTEFPFVDITDDVEKLIAK